MAAQNAKTNADRAGLALAIEARSIDFVPLTERHGQAWHQGPFWFTGNFNFFTLAIGFIGPALGLGFWNTSLASVLGLLFGTVFMALHASQGPELGLPQMIQSRAQFGYRGVLVALVGTLVTFLGFNVVDTVLVSQGLGTMFHLNFLETATGLALVAVVLAIFGYDWLHSIFRILFWVSLPLYLWLTFAIGSGTFPALPPKPESFTWLAFAAQFAACASYNITFAPYVSDYTRYLAPERARGVLLWSVYLGASLSAIWLTLLGAWLACRLGASDGMQSLRSAGDLLFPHGGLVLLAISVAALAAAMGLNAYSGMLTVVTGLNSVAKTKPSRGLRIVCIVVLALVWVAAASQIKVDAIGALNSGLAAMLYLLAPWSAINLVDYFVVRRRRYAIAELFKPSGVYGAWAWRGLVSYALGFAASIPFFSLTGIYVGTIAQKMGGADISWIPGLIVSGVAYWVLTLSQDRSSEMRLIVVADPT